MSDLMTVVWLVAGLGFLLVAGARLGAGGQMALMGLFASHGVRDWPTGVQEADAPHFAVTHLDNLRPGHAAAFEWQTGDADEPGEPGDAPELIDLGSRPLGARPR